MQDSGIQSGHIYRVKGLKSSLADFALLQEIGKGAYSQVYKVRRFADSKIYALKKIDFGRFSQKEKDNALLEISILTSVNSPNVIQLYEAIIDEDS
jgi:NIMA (never in mitosis gene a)-related kinase